MGRQRSRERAFHTQKGREPVEIPIGDRLGRPVVADLNTKCFIFNVLRVRSGVRAKGKFFTPDLGPWNYSLISQNEAGASLGERLTFAEGLAPTHRCGVKHISSNAVVLGIHNFLKPSP